jgi:N-dimethylarginine dimethylaminohydrolase
MISSYNEYDTLKKIVVGDASYAIIDEANEDLQGLCNILTDHGVEVVRPDTMNFQAHDGMYNYCPRDRFIVYGSTVIDPAMLYPCRDMEYQCYADILKLADRVIHMPRAAGMVLDAANVLRVSRNQWLFLESASGNRVAYEWLCDQVPEVEIELCNFYAGVHIDSTIVALNATTFLVNGSRVKSATLPKMLQDKLILYVNEVVPQDFYQYPYASKWIALNMLSINPHTVIVDSAQTDLIRTLESRLGMTVIPHQLRHSRTLGGGFHCTTLDLIRG